ncbi:MAG: hypothetical protein LBV74_02420 [Tannerella sp.]|jgi:hypothetical protein|nr:hypothetical protein [Tannerella sp.]
MIDTMYIGSGDIYALLSGKHTKGHQALMRRFVSGIKPYYNALLSPIDALRTGVILKERYLLDLPDNSIIKYPVCSSEMDVFKCTIDHVSIERDVMVDFEKVKTINLSDYMDFMRIKKNKKQLLGYICKKYRNYYNQVQEQLYCTELDSCNLVFLSVTSYDDEINEKRNIQPDDFFKVRIYRDEDVISMIKERGKVFQQIKDYYNE